MATIEKPVTEVHNRRGRLKGLLFVFFLASIGFVPIMAFVYFDPRMLWQFPIGVVLLYLSMADLPYVDAANAAMEIAPLVIWLCLLGSSIAIVTSASKKLSMALFGALILFLILNLVGWYYQFFSHIT